MGGEEALEKAIQNEEILQLHKEIEEITTDRGINEENSFEKYEDLDETPGKNIIDLENINGETETTEKLVALSPIIRTLETIKVEKKKSTTVPPPAASSSSSTQPIPEIVLSMGGPTGTIGRLINLFVKLIKS